MADKTAYHPDGIHVVRFNEQWHTYRDNLGSRYVSGTTFVGKFFPKFDMVAVSEQCAAGDNPKYAGRDPQEIRAEWKAEGKRGSSEGDNTHEYAEGVMAGWKPWELPEPISERCKALFRQVNRITKFLKSKYQFIAAEKIVFSPLLGIAGMIDLLMFDPATQEILILDWKQNKGISTENFHQKALEPIDHLQDTHISKYSMQLSLYQHILIRERYYPQAKGYRRALIHLTPDNVRPIKLDDHNYEIKELIKYDKRK